MSRLLLLVAFGFSFGLRLSAQPLNFETTNFYTAQGKTLKASGENLSQFNFSDVRTATHPLRGNGIYFPVKDFDNKNLWVRVRYLRPDPNGTSVGWNVPETQNSPFRAGGFGGWWGFLYQFDIYLDSVTTGPPAYKLGPPGVNNISVESIETLGWTEWLSFRIMNQSSSGWFLITKNLGSNPTSDPAFSSTTPYFPQTNLTQLYTPDFPNGADSVYVVDLPGGSFSEFRMGANGVSSFLYGYEYDSPGGYQGMTLSFGQTAIADNQPNQKKLTAHPNPTIGIVHLNHFATGVVCNALGKELQRFAGQEVSLEHLPVGLYTLQTKGQAPVWIVKQ